MVWGGGASSGLSLDAEEAAPWGCDDNPGRKHLRVLLWTPGLVAREDRGAEPGWGRQAWKALSHWRWASVESMCELIGKLVSVQSGLPAFQALAV